MNWAKLALTLGIISVLVAAIVFAPHIGLGDFEQFVLYRWLRLSRSQSLIIVLILAVGPLLYWIAEALASVLKLGLQQASAHERGNTNPRYRPEIDGLRAVAVSAVIINHLDETYLPGGFLGVDVFFVISGYVFLASMLANNNRSLTEFLLSFYARRARRLLPGLAVFVVICAIATCLVSPTPGPSLWTGMTALFGVSNVQLYWQAADYFAPSAQYNTFTHTWSLGVEEQFYLIAPLIVFLTALRWPNSKGRGILLITLCALASLSLAYRWYAGLKDPAGAFFLMPARFWEIAVGGILYLLVMRSGGISARLVPVSPIAFIVMVGMFLVPARYADASTVLVVLATCLLIASDKVLCHLSNSESATTPIHWSDFLFALSLALGRYID